MLTPQEIRPSMMMVGGIWGGTLRSHDYPILWRFGMEKQFAVERAVQLRLSNCLTSAGKSWVFGRWTTATHFQFFFQKQAAFRNQTHHWKLTFWFWMHGDYGTPFITSFQQNPISPPPFHTIYHGAPWRVHLQKPSKGIATNLDNHTLRGQEAGNGWDGSWGFQMGR